MQSVSFEEILHELSIISKWRLLKFYPENFKY